MKKLVLFGFILMFVGGVVAIYGNHAQELQDDLDRSRWQEIKTAEKYASFVDRFNSATTKSDYVSLEENLVLLPKKYQESLGPQIKLKVSLLDFAEAEELLNRARRMQASLTIPSPAPPPRQVGIDGMGNPVYSQDPPEPTKVHPMAMELFNKAVPLYQSSKRDLDRLTEVKGDDGHNFRLNYAKGEVYYRYTQLFSTQETAKELFNQTVTYFKHALRYKPADTDTVINIELLIKNEPDMTGGSNNPGQQKNKLLNQAPGSGHSKGN